MKRNLRSRTFLTATAPRNGTKKHHGARNMTYANHGSMQSTHWKWGKQTPKESGTSQA